MNKTIKLTIEHSNGNTFETLIDTYEYNSIMRTLMFSTIHAPSYNDANIHRKISISQKLEEKNLHNGNVSPNDGGTKP